MGLLNNGPETLIVGLYDVVAYLRLRVFEHAMPAQFAQLDKLLNFHDILSDFVESSLRGGNLGQITSALERIGIHQHIAMEITNDAFNLTVERVGQVDHELTMGYEDHITFRVDEIFDLYISRIKTG